MEKRSFHWHLFDWIFTFLYRVYVINNGPYFVLMSFSRCSWILKTNVQFKKPILTQLTYKIKNGNFNEIYFDECRFEPNDHLPLVGLISQAFTNEIAYETNTI